MRASGPGGQNVNKVASAVQLRFDLAGTAALTDAGEAAAARAGRPAGDRRRRDADHRAQPPHAGTEPARGAERLAELIRRALVPPKIRKATKPTRASKERRLETKTRTQRTKVLRTKVRRWDD